LPRLGKPRVERREQAERRGSTDRELGGAFEEATAIDEAVNVGVEELEELGIEIGGRTASRSIGRIDGWSLLHGPELLARDGYCLVSLM
jgi:hypothetical protein